MDYTTKRSTGLSSAIGELRYWAPMGASALVLYGTCAVGEAYVVFGSSLKEYIRSKSSLQAASMSLKLRSYKAVAARHAFSVPPPLVMPNSSQLSQLMALRSLKLLVGVGAAAIVTINTVVAYRQGVQGFEQLVLEGGMLNINMGTNSPYFVRKGNKNSPGNESIIGKMAKPPFIMRYGGIQDVTSMLSSSGGYGGNHVALPVLMNLRGNTHGGNKRELHIAVRDASKGLNEGCYVRQDMVCSLPSLPRGHGSRIIMQAGGFVKKVTRRKRSVMDICNTAAKELIEQTGAEVHVVLLRCGNGSVRPNNSLWNEDWIAEAVQSREAADDYGLISIDARLGMVCDVIEWIDRHKVSVAKTTDRKSVLATSAQGVGRMEERARRKSHREREDARMPEATPPQSEKKKFEARDDDEWILVERVGSRARVILVSSWQLASSIWGRLEQVTRTTTASAMTLVTVTWPKEVRRQIGLGARAIENSFCSLSISLQAGVASVATSLASISALYSVKARKARRAVILDLGPSVHLFKREDALSWLTASWSGSNSAREDPLGHALLYGLRHASVTVALWSGPAAEAPDVTKESEDAPLVLVYHAGPRGKATGRAAAAEFAKKGYECCIVEDSSDFAGGLHDPPPGKRTTVIDTNRTAQNLWEHATLQLADGRGANEVATAIRKNFERVLGKL